MKIRNKLFKLACPLICTAGMLSTTALAEDDDDLGSISLEDLLNLEVVSATRSESKLSESPVPISVITAKEIASSGLDNIPDILARLPEIDVIRIGASQTEVSIRGKGINFNRRLLTMIDGRTEYNDLFGATLWNAFPIAVDDISRIEVVRGPASALFGANAYSGVINIITKPIEESGGLVRYHTGDDNRQYANIMGQFHKEKLNGKVSFVSQNLDNPNSNVVFEGFNRFATTTNFVETDESLDGVTRANLQINYAPSEKMDFKVSYGMNSGDYELFQQPGLPRANWDIDTEYSHFIANYYIEDGPSYQFNVYQNTFEYKTPLVPTRADLSELALTDGQRYFPALDEAMLFNGKVDTFDATFQAVGKAMEGKVNWVAGTEYREVENKGGLVADEKKDITSYFANFTWKVSDDWQLGAGYRIDDDSITGQDDGYTLSLSHFLNDTDSIRFTARSAFRAPSLFELYSQIDLKVPFQNQSIRFRGNSTDITVETITSYDVTYTSNINETMQLTVEVFFEEYKDIIGNPDSGLLEDVVLDPVTDQFTTTTSFQNLADAESEGLQVGLVWIATESLQTYANYRMESTTDLNSVPGETFFTPEHKFNLGANWKISDKLNADISMNYVGETDEAEFVGGNVSPDGPNFTRDNQASYQTLNLSLRYNTDWVEGLELYFNAYNMLDDNHVEYFEYDQVLKGVGEEFGRSVWGGFSWKF